MQGRALFLVRRGSDASLCCPQFAIAQRQLAEDANNSLATDAKEMDKDVVETAMGDDAQGMGGLRSALEHAKADAKTWRLKMQDLKHKAREWEEHKHGMVFFGQKDAADYAGVGAFDTPAFFWGMFGGEDEEETKTAVTQE